jgi:hypothetical protein
MPFLAANEGQGHRTARTGRNQRDRIVQGQKGVNSTAAAVTISAKALSSPRPSDPLKRDHFRLKERNKVPAIEIWVVMNLLESSQRFAGLVAPHSGRPPDLATIHTRVQSTEKSEVIGNLVIKTRAQHGVVRHRAHLGSCGTDDPPSTRSAHMVPYLIDVGAITPSPCRLSSKSTCLGMYEGRTTKSDQRRGPSLVEARTGQSEAYKRRRSRRHWWRGGYRDPSDPSVGRKSG